MTCSAVQGVGQDTLQCGKQAGGAHSMASQHSTTWLPRLQPHLRFRSLPGAGAASGAHDARNKILGAQVVIGGHQARWPADLNARRHCMERRPEEWNASEQPLTSDLCAAVQHGARCAPWSPCMPASSVMLACCNR